MKYTINIGLRDNNYSKAVMTDNNLKELEHRLLNHLRAIYPNADHSLLSQQCISSMGLDASRICRRSLVRSICFRNLCPRPAPS